jgi:hypothetical protein
MVLAWKSLLVAVNTHVLHCSFVLRWVDLASYFTFAPYVQLRLMFTPLLGFIVMFELNWPSSSAQVVLKECAVLLFLCNCLWLYLYWHCAVIITFSLNDNITIFFYSGSQASILYAVLICRCLDRAKISLQFICIPWHFVKCCWHSPDSQHEGRPLLACPLLFSTCSAIIHIWKLSPTATPWWQATLNNGNSGTALKLAFGPLLPH